MRFRYTKTGSISYRALSLALSLAVLSSGLGLWYNLSSLSATAAASGSYLNESVTVSVELFDYYYDYGEGGNNNYLGDDTSGSAFDTFNSALSSYYEDYSVTWPTYFGCLYPNGDWESDSVGNGDFSDTSADKVSSVLGLYNFTWRANMALRPKDEPDTSINESTGEQNETITVEEYSQFYAAVQGLVEGSASTTDYYGNSTDYYIPSVLTNSGTTVNLPYFDEAWIDAANSSNTTTTSSGTDVAAYYSDLTWEISSQTVENNEIAYQDMDGEYYVFDSSTMAAHYNSTTGTIDVSTDEGDYVYDSEGNAGFFPFNDPGTDGSGSAYSLNYGFGMRMDIDFSITDEGTVDGTEDGDAVKFAFKGDDDVWIYIDGELALDLGGAHKYASGVIDFKTQKVYLTYVAEIDDDNKYDVRGTNDHLGINSEEDYGDSVVTAYDYLDDDSSNDTTVVVFTFEELGIEIDSSSTHTLTMFYMERGMINSNLYIQFNLGILDEFSLTDTLVADNVNEGLLAQTLAIADGDVVAYTLQNSGTDADDVINNIAILPTTAQTYTRTNKITGLSKNLLTYLITASDSSITLSTEVDDDYLYFEIPGDLLYNGSSKRVYIYAYFWYDDDTNCLIRLKLVGYKYDDDLGDYTYLYRCVNPCRTDTEYSICTGFKLVGTTTKYDEDYTTWPVDYTNGTTAFPSTCYFQSSNMTISDAAGRVTTLDSYSAGSISCSISEDSIATTVYNYTYYNFDPDTSTAVANVAFTLSDGHNYYKTDINSTSGEAKIADSATSLNGDGTLVDITTEDGTIYLQYGQSANFQGQFTVGSEMNITLGDSLYAIDSSSNTLSSASRDLTYYYTVQSVQFLNSTGSTTSNITRAGSTDITFTYDDEAYSMVESSVRYAEEVIVTRSINTGNLEITKSITNGESSDETFTIYVHFSELFGSDSSSEYADVTDYRDVTYTSSDGTSGTLTNAYVTDDSDGTTTVYGKFTIQAGETVKISGIPVGTKYTVTEVEASDSDFSFDEDSSSNLSGTITTDGSTTSTYSFTVAELETGDTVDTSSFTYTGTDGETHTGVDEVAADDYYTVLAALQEQYPSDTYTISYTSDYDSLVYTFSSAEENPVIYFDNSELGWTTVYAVFTYTDADGSSATEMTVTLTETNEDGYLYIDLASAIGTDADYTTATVYFTDGTYTSETLSINGQSHLFSGSLTESKSYGVYVYATSSTATLYCHFWEDGGATLTSWPGVALEYTGETYNGFYVYYLDLANYSSANRMIINNSSSETATYSFTYGTYSYYYYANNWSSSNTIRTMTADTVTVFAQTWTRVAASTDTATTSGSTTSQVVSTLGVTVTNTRKVADLLIEQIVEDTSSGTTVDATTESGSGSDEIYSYSVTLSASGFDLEDYLDNMYLYTGTSSDTALASASGYTYSAYYNFTVTDSDGDTVDLSDISDLSEYLEDDGTVSNENLANVISYLNTYEYTYSYTCAASTITLTVTAAAEQSGNSASGYDDFAITSVPVGTVYTITETAVDADSEYDNQSTYWKYSSSTNTTSTTSMPNASVTGTIRLGTDADGNANSNTNPVTGATDNTYTTASITNTRQMADIKITKTVDFADYEDVEGTFSFTFTVTLTTPADAGDYTITYPNSSGTSTTTTLSAGEKTTITVGVTGLSTTNTKATATISNLPYGTTYSISENSNASFTNGTISNSSGTVTGSVAASVTNTYSASYTPTAYLVLTKYVDKLYYYSDSTDGAVDDNAHSYSSGDSVIGSDTTDDDTYGYLNYTEAAQTFTFTIQKYASDATSDSKPLEEYEVYIEISADDKLATTVTYGGTTYYYGESKAFEVEVGYLYLVTEQGTGTGTTWRYDLTGASADVLSGTDYATFGTTDDNQAYVNYSSTTAKSDGTVIVGRVIFYNVRNAAETGDEGIESDMSSITNTITNTITNS